MPAADPTHTVHPTPVTHTGAHGSLPGGEGRKVFFVSFGCQMNVLDAELVLGDLDRNGYGRTDKMKDADVVLINTCSIREHAEDKVWSLLGRARQVKETRPKMKIGVMGCMAQRVKDEIVHRAPHVDLVLGTSSFRSAVQDLDDLFDGGGRIVRTSNRPDPVFLPDADRNVTVRPDAYRAFVTIMRGCNHSCTYCIVPHTRGKEVSRPLPEILDEVKRLVDDGAREVTFLGQNINTYGQDLHPKRKHTGEICTLLEHAAEVEGLDRIRFLTSNPFDMTEDMMRRFGAVEKVMPWLHIPAQSGSDEVLRRMQRTYTVAQYHEVVGWARTHIPGVEITSDFIVGFSGETDEDFEGTKRLVEDIGFLQTYVFKYSVRPKTLSARRLPDDVPEDVKKRRNVELLGVQDALATKRNQGLIGETVRILVEGISKSDDTRISGRDRCNRIVHAPGDASMSGRMADVQIAEAGAHSFIGDLVRVEGDGERWPDA
ncbi:MAG: tRNA (N6-isopentenyl adenosine(37)-C2)-methylthiotransferase MiaB [Planctomycetota bacterium]|nr:tRNA (N6-isopentenyl adenosine(37)-C2)-methylthiotransferase MiaB [Planctomycetota bacterium]